MMVKSVVDRVADSNREFLDAFMAETNLLEGIFFRKVTLEVTLSWKHISHEKHLAFFG